MSGTRRKGTLRGGERALPDRQTDPLSFPPSLFSLSWATCHNNSKVATFIQLLQERKRRRKLLRRRRRDFSPTREKRKGSQGPL